MRDITGSKMRFKPGGAVKERFASCIVVRSVVGIRLVMEVITLRSDSGNAPRTSLNLTRPSDVHDEFDLDVADPHLGHFITTARALARLLQMSSSLLERLRYGLCDCYQARSGCMRKVAWSAV